MNDQQSPSAPDPQAPKPSQAPPPPLRRPRHEAGLSDQEAFALLAESMADNRNGAGNGAAAGRTVPAPQKQLSRFAPHEWRRIAPAANMHARAEADPMRTDMPPVVPFRIDSSQSDAAPADHRSSEGTEGGVNGRHRFDWSTPILVDEQWELVDPPDVVDPIHGQVTEVIDLTQVPPVVVTADLNGLKTVIGHGNRDSESRVDASIGAPVPPRPTNRILPPVEESTDAESLPPLVFLNTRGDIIPRVGETPNGDNHDTFENEAAARDGGGPPADTATSASGVENMADPWADTDAAADPGRATGPSGDGAEPGLTDAGDAQLFQPSATSQAPADPTVDPFVPIDPASAHSAMVPPTADDVEPDARLDELQRIFDQYSGPVIAVIASIAGDRRAIDEALQSTFEAVWKTVDTFDAQQPRGPWMFTLARRLATEQVERARRLEHKPQPGRYPVPSHRQDQVTEVDKSWEAWEVRLAVDQLSRAEHDVLRLIHNEGLIHPEIAAQLQTTVGAVKSHAYSGSHRLVELLDHVIRPDATDELTVDQASALTWYLAGVADGSDLDTEERSAVRRVQAQLASATAWIRPDVHARDRVISFARRTIDDPGPLSGGGAYGLSDLGSDGSEVPLDRAGSAVTGRHRAVAEAAPSVSRPWLIVGLSALGFIALVAAFSLRSGTGETGSETLRRFEMQPSGLDADATGVVEITTVATGTRFELEFGGLDPSTDEYFYAAWLQSTAGGGVVPLGTFSWEAAGDPLALSGPVWSGTYDLLVITRSEPMTRASIDDPAVLSVSIE